MCFPTLLVCSPKPSVAILVADSRDDCPTLSFLPASGFEFGGVPTVLGCHQPNRNRKVPGSRQVALWTATSGFLISQHSVVNSLIKKAAQHPLQLHFPMQCHDIVRQCLMPEETPEVLSRQQKRPY